MSQISRGFRAALQNLLPSSRFLCKNVASTYVVGTPTKSNVWKVASPFLLNRNGITNNPARPPFLPSSSSSSSSSLHSATYSSKDKEAGTSKGKDDQVKKALFKKISKEKVKILRVLLDYDDPQNHLNDSLVVMSYVLHAWRKFQPDFDLTYGFRDIKTALDLLSHHRLSAVFHWENISRSERKILKLLLDYDDPKFADLVLLLAINFWKCIISDCIDVWSMDKDKHDDDVKNNSIPLSVKNRLMAYKMLMINYDDIDDMIKVLTVHRLKAYKMLRFNHRRRK